MDCEGVCCEIGNYAVKFDSGIALYIYGDVITTMLVLSLVFLLLKLHLGYASTEQSSKKVRANITRIISTVQEDYVVPAAVDEYGNLEDGVSLVYYALSLLAALWFALEGAALFLPQNNTVRIILRIMYDGHGTPLRPSGADAGVEERALEESVRVILDNWPIVYAFMPYSFKWSPVLASLVVMAMYGVKLVVTYFLFQLDCQICSLFFPAPEGFYVYCVYVAFYLLILLDIYFGPPFLQPRKTIRTWVIYLIVVWLIAMAGSALLLFLDNDIGFCVVNFDALLYTVAYAPLLYSMFMAESRLIRYRRSVLSEASSNLYGTTDPTGSQGSLTRLLQENPEQDARDMLRKYPTITWINVSELKWGKLIGKGGMGEVYMATWNGSPVALKKLFRAGGKNVADFFKEVTVMSKLSHPNIVLFMGVSVTSSGDYIIVTEYVTRGSLWDLLHPDMKETVSSESDDDDEYDRTPDWGGTSQRQRRSVEDLGLTPSVAHRILLHTARGMAYLHSMTPPIIHRDLKSQNLLLDETWTVKVADFGLARVEIQNTMTATGTPQWSAPEVIRHEHYSTQADVYSFGIIIYEVLTGVVPYKGMAALNAAHTVAYGGLRPKFRPGSDTLYASLARECWDENPDVRPTFESLVDRISKMRAPELSHS